MQFSQLSAVKHRVVLGQPLPFNIRNADHTLLLARGHMLGSHEQMEALFERGALVDIAELRTPLAPVMDAPPEMLPALWGQCLDNVGQTLKASSQPGFVRGRRSDPTTRWLTRERATIRSSSRRLRSSGSTR